MLAPLAPELAVFSAAAESVAWLEVTYATVFVSIWEEVVLVEVTVTAPVAVARMPTMPSDPPGLSVYELPVSSPSVLE
jgi:hypothetical protein